MITKMPTNRNGRKNSETARKMIYASFFAALIFLATAYLPRIPTSLGYVHLGDGFILLAASILPTPYALAASAIGGSLADLLTGYAVWAPGTFVIKALMALCISSRTKRMTSPRNIIGIIPASLINAGGYYLFQSLLISGNFIAALPEIPFNIIQTVVGGVVFVVVGALMEQSSAIKNMLPNGGRGESPERFSRSENQQKDENKK